MERVSVLREMGGVMVEVVVDSGDVVGFVVDAVGGVVIRFIVGNVVDVVGATSMFNSERGWGGVVC